MTLTYNGEDFTWLKSRQNPLNVGRYSFLFSEAIQNFELQYSFIPHSTHNKSHNNTAETLGRDPFNQNSNRSDWEKRTTSKGGPVFSKLFRLDRTDPLSFGPKFPEILVEWIAPLILSHNGIMVLLEGLVTYCAWFLSYPRK